MVAKESRAPTKQSMHWIDRFLGSPRRRGLDFVVDLLRKLKVPEIIMSGIASLGVNQTANTIWHLYTSNPQKPAAEMQEIKDGFIRKEFNHTDTPTNRHMSPQEAYTQIAGKFNQKSDA